MKVEADKKENTSDRLRWLLYTGAVVAAAQIVVATSRLSTTRVAVSAIDAVVLLCILFAVIVHSTNPYDVEVGSHRASVYLDDPLILPVILTFGWQIGIIIVCFKAVYSWSVVKRPWYKAMYTASANGLSYLIAEWVFLKIAAETSLITDPERVVLGVLTGAATVPLCNAPLIGLAIHLSQRGSGYLPATHDRRVFGFYAVESGLATSSTLLMMVSSIAALPLMGTLVFILASWNGLARKRARTDAFLKRLVDEVELRNPYSADHSQRVANLAMELGRKIGLSQVRVRGLGRAALWHDIGKLSVADRILFKTSKLNGRERALIEDHVRSATSMVGELDEVGNINMIIEQHHERLDGKGYPFGLKADEILPESRVLAVVEAYDTMTTEQPYREPLTPERALSEISRDVNKRYDASIVVALAEVLGIDYQVTDTRGDGDAPLSEGDRVGSRVLLLEEARIRNRQARSSEQGDHEVEDD